MGLRVRLKNDATPLEADWWSWSVWLEGTDDALDQIKSVKYLLHPTFPDPIRVVTDRASKFRLSATGWGEFAITAHIEEKNGEVISLERWLRFHGPGHEASGDRGPRPCVFLSFSATDRPLVRVLSEHLKKEGIEVVAPEDVAVGESWQRSIEDAIRRAHVVAFLTSGEMRGFAEQELAIAQQGSKAIVPILVGTATELPEPFTGISAMHLRSPSDVGPVADLLAARANDMFHPDDA